MRRGVVYVGDIRFVWYVALSLGARPGHLSLRHCSIVWTLVIGSHRYVCIFAHVLLVVDVGPRPSTSAIHDMLASIARCGGSMASPVDD